MQHRPVDLNVEDPDLSASERSFRLGWIAALRRPGGVRPSIGPDYVARQGRALRVVDIRDAESLYGPLGHVPGSDWIPLADAGALHQRIGAYEPLVIVCEDGARSLALAGWLEEAGLHMVAALDGGMRAWREHGLLPSRDRALCERRGELSGLLGWHPPRPREVFTLDEIREHVGDPRSVRWLKLAAFLLNGRLACVDGRDSTAVVGSPGGDAGEFVLGLAALEDLRGAALDDDAIDRLLARRIEAFGRFAFHTDVAAGDRMIAALRADPRTSPALVGLKDFVAFRKFFSAPPPAYRDAIAEIMVHPDHLGCGHLRLTAQQSARWGVRPGLTQRVLRAAVQLRWAGLQELEITPLPGGHGEGAVLNVRIAEPMSTFAYVPLVAPSIAGRQLFVNHPDAAGYLRVQLARWLARQTDVVGPVDEGALTAGMQALHGRQIGETLGALAAGLPIFDVTMRRDGAPDVAFVGHVPA